MNALERRLLNDYQRNFPLVPLPYASIAASCGTGEETVREAYSRYLAQGTISRIGAAFGAGRIGAGMLAAMVVPHERVERVAALVSASPAVNHNYLREHRYNLWFVVTGACERDVEASVREIEESARCGRVLRLPMVEPYHVDLGFDLNASGGCRQTSAACGVPRTPQALTPAERDLVAALQEGLPLDPRPYALLARRAGMDEATVLDTLRGWCESGVINRFGVIVRHHELGYQANAMVVWDVPDDEVTSVGRRVALAPRVNLCYRRLRHPPEWRYNLYCMLHGAHRDEVLSQVAQLRVNRGLLAYPHEILFSTRRYKQRGAHYVETANTNVHG